MARQATKTFSQDFQPAVKVGRLGEQIVRQCTRVWSSFPNMNPRMPITRCLWLWGGISMAAAFILSLIKSGPFHRTAAG